MSPQEALHSVSVSGVVTDHQGRVLLIQRRDNRHWEPPGGVLETSEPIEDGLRREVREETGLEVDPIALTGVYKNMSRAIVALVFRCTVTGGELAVNDEVAGFRWATPAEAGDMTAEAYAVRILDALSGRPVPAVRQHDGNRLLAPAATQHVNHLARLVLPSGGGVCAEGAIGPAGCQLPWPHAAASSRPPAGPVR